jgi:hypothetical protein
VRAYHDSGGLQESSISNAYDRIRQQAVLEQHFFPARHLRRGGGNRLCAARYSSISLKIGSLSEAAMVAVGATAPALAEMAATVMAAPPAATLAAVDRKWRRVVSAGVLVGGVLCTRSAWVMWN